MEDGIVRMAADRVLLTLVVAAAIHGISYIRFLWTKMKSEGQEERADGSGSPLPPKAQRTDQSADFVSAARRRSDSSSR